jgi:LL-diaminopimelate aminotransferase
MPNTNSSFSNLKQRYLFALIQEKVEASQKKNLINLGIGDIARPLLKEIADAISHAVYEMTCIDTLKGYGPETGYSFLKNAIVKNEYAKLGITEDEIFISEGINPEITVFHELIKNPMSIALQDPSYPAYYDTQIIAGNLSQENSPYYLDTSEETLFCPTVPKEKVDLIYLNSPNNPTGSAMTRQDLKKFVDYANQHSALILFDGAYEAFIQSDDIPKSIFEIEGAKSCAVEFRSFSKSAGFTGLRCGYVVVPKELVFSNTSINSLWRKYKTIRSNGVSYPIQKGAEKTFDPFVQEKLKLQITSYLKQTSALKEALNTLGLKTFGGQHAPFIFLKTPQGYNSWEFFDYLLNEAHVISIPGSGFGKNGEGFVRLSGLITEATFERAITQFKALVERGLYETHH